MSIDITSAINGDARKKLERLVGSALLEGASEDAVLVYLQSVGATEPERLIARVLRLKVTPHLTDLELKRLGGRAKLREQFGLPPEPTGDMPARALTQEDFVAYMPDHSYYCIPTQAFWHPTSITNKVASPLADRKICEWLDDYRHVEQMTWAPGKDPFITDTIVSEGGLIPRVGMTVLNLYRPPQPCKHGDASLATPWLQHFYRIYPTDADHMIKWLAHRVQKPDIKINHGLVWGGVQGIGKDTVLIPVRRAVGEWNCQDIGPDALMGRFNGYLKSVFLRVNEANDLGDVNRYQLYERSKVLLASPPEVLRVDEKNLREHQILNVVGVCFTTNYKVGGLYLPPDDRRHYVAWSDARMENFDTAYWNRIHHWYEHEGGKEHVMAYLLQPDRLDGFDPKAHPPRTAAWHEMVNSNRSHEESEVADLIDLLKRPEALTVGDLVDVARDSNTAEGHAMAEWLADRKNTKAVPRKLEACGYVAHQNPGDKTHGQWKVDGKRLTVYVRNDVAVAGRDAAVAKRQRLDV